MNALTFKDLVDLKADEWNTQVASEYDIDVEELKDIITRRDLRLIENRLQNNITKEEIEDLASDQKSEDTFNSELFKEGDVSVVYEPTVLDKFIIRISDTEDIVDSVAITGKVIIGAKFSNSNLSNSYFCGCTFYKCDLTDVDFGNSVFVSCDFIDCEMTRVDFTGSTISRSHFYECILVSSTFDYVALSECMFVACDFDFATFIQCRILFTGFSDCALTNVDWKDSDIVQSTFTNCNCRDGDFKRAVMVVSILIRVRLIGCDLNSLSVTCLTISECEYEDKYKHFFEMEHLLYSPAIFEWDDSDDMSIDSDIEDVDDFDEPWTPDE
jgi:fluoroquinolone resistance protein